MPQVPQNDAHAQATGAVGRARWAVIGVGLLALVFTAGTFLAPALMDSGRPWGGLLRLSYAPLCHQQPERSLRVGRGVQAVCARCSGLYLGGVAGFFAGALFVVGRRRRLRPRWLLLAALPTFVDATLHGLGGPGLPNLPRLALAWPVGFVAALFVARGIEELLAPRGGVGGALVDHDLRRSARRVGRGSVEVIDG